MFTTTTYFIKAQTPGINVHKLLDLYKRELNTQGIKNITEDGNVLYFVNDDSEILFNRFDRRFSDFSEGKIGIEDNDTEFLAYMEATPTNFMSGLTAKVSFPVYFTALRNDIERELQGL
jgi:hypothetical protein